jgi:macrolide transport system ATP-binding/permease protein
VPQLAENMKGGISDISGEEWNVLESANSGGEITRKKLAQAFSTSSELLLCDEPTTNLDEDGIAQLENSLMSYGGSILLISHDRALLDKVCNKIWELEDGALTEYHGNYSDYKTQKDIENKTAWDQYDKYVAERKHLQGALINRRSKAKSMKNPPKRMGNSEARLHRQDVRQRAGKVEQASTQIKRRLLRLETKDKPKEEASFKMSANISREYVSKTAVSVDRLSFSYGAREVLKDISLKVKRGEKVAVTGANGSGKSTLLNCIYNECDGVRTAPGAKLGYFRQDLKNLNDDDTVLYSVKKESTMPEHIIRTVLGRLGMRRDEVFKKIGVLSGGERCKTSLAKLICGGYPILLLDEPTNYLDIYVLEALEEMLEGFDGTVILVSHDRYFRKKITGREVELKSHLLFEKNKNAPIKKKDKNTMLLEMEKADLISRMTYPQKGDVREGLEARYNEVCELLNENEAERK